ncbi:hypothetical protein QR680_012052 [Steinernema hermaphroditum]|uniref:Prolylcarboxypeptidase n=1 Tax=Steinernema hermaphroditum TaxID=289476 RepID=A0AA39I0R4_9BILA|nr:hypothetical protein QR680_012052 [Steinernema hermaphroditum]
MVGRPWQLLSFLLLLSISVSAARRPLSDPASFFRADLLREGGYNWTEEWYEFMPLDHFDFIVDTKFQLRFLINLDHYRDGGPIFFYTGNEGNIEGFANNTGFMWDIAPEYGAALVFAEHRFYGKTQPFGKESYKSVKNLGYLSSTQALADFATLVDWLRKERIPGAKNSAVVAFGGSYGGMLAAWFRMKYPHLCDGAIAASAPVFWFRNTKTPDDVYDRIVSRSFVNSGCDAKAVLQSWTSLRKLAKTATGRVFLNGLFKLANESHIATAGDVDFLVAFIKEAMESMAMVNYPYPTEFLAPLPGWPVQKACESFKTTKQSDEEYAKALYDVVNLYYNFTGATKELCANPKTCSGAYAALGDPLGWPWQSCTEMVMPQCASSLPNDFFEKDCPFTVENFLSFCTSTFESIGYNPEFMRPDWAMTVFGDHFPAASNIVFSNGYLDPWSGGGWALKPKTEGSLVSLIIDDGAHHYDLRGAHANDTASVKEARRIEKAHINRWVKRAEHSRRIKAVHEAKWRRKEEHRRREKPKRFKFDF